MALEAFVESFSHDLPVLHEKAEIIRVQSPGVAGTRSEMIEKKQFNLNPKDLLKTEQNREVLPFSSTQSSSFVFKSAPRPWFPPEVLRKLRKMQKTPLRKAEMVGLVEDIAKISMEFYQVRPGAFIAMNLNGRIVESADSEIDLLLRIQGKKFDTSVIVWEAGSESFSGWRSRRQKEV